MRIFTGAGGFGFSGLTIGIPVLFRRRFMEGASAREALPPA